MNLENIRTVARELRRSLVENAENLSLSVTEIYDTIQYIQQYGSGITQQQAEGTIRYIQTYGQLPDNARQLMLDAGFDENDILEIENMILENPQEIEEGMPVLGLKHLREEYWKTIEPFVYTAAASLHIEAATLIERQLSDPSLTPREYVSELDNWWSIVSSDLAESQTYDNLLYDAMKLENWQDAHGRSDNLMIFAENRALEVTNDIRFSRSARSSFRENGTSENIKYAAEKELQFTKALDRYLYYYQKGLYFEMITLAALNGDNELALEEASNARSMQFTIPIGEQVWQPLADAPGVANMTAEVAEDNGVKYVYVARLYQHHLDRYRIGTDGWTQTSSLSENAWGWDAGSSLAYAENGGIGYIYALIGGDTREFWRYNIENDSWENTGYTPDIVSSGGSLTWTGENVLYATRGKSSTDFWLYHLENNTWDNIKLTPTPGALETGACLAWDENDYLYTFKGGASTSFYRYSISADTWATLASASAGVGAGGSLEWENDYIWATRGGGTTDFWRYNPIMGSWENSTSTPATVGTRAGDRLARHKDYLYLPRGESDNQFWRFKLVERRASIEELLANPSKYDNKEIWVSGFASGYERRRTSDNREYSVFNLTTNEGLAPPADNTRYWRGENVNTSEGDNVKLERIPAGDHVVISEVYPDPVVSYDRTEYVKLYNPTSTDISLDGYSLWEETTEKITFGSENVIPAHSYYLIADGQYSDYKDQENADWPEPDATAAWALSNSGDAVILIDPDSNVVDQFGYEATDNYEGTIYPSTPPEGSSAERYSSTARDPAEDQGNSYDTDNNANDFFDQSSPNPENSTYIESPPSGGYKSSSYLESSIYDAGLTVDWENVKWSSIELSGTNIDIMIRTGNSATIDNTWTKWKNMTNGQSIIENSRYIQHQAEFSTDNDALTPKLKQIEITYSLSSQIREWIQSDWSGGPGRELWSAQQKLALYFPQGWADVQLGVGENSYSKFYGLFYASHPNTGRPQLNLRSVQLLANGEVAPSSTPIIVDR